jgi:hypothetical protein
MGYGMIDQSTEVRFQSEAQIFSPLTPTQTPIRGVMEAISVGRKANGTRRYLLPFSAKG